MTPQILPARSSSIPTIIERLQSGQVVVLPSATVYVLAANSLSEQAVAQMYHLKQWRSPQPLSVFSHAGKAKDLFQLSPSALKMLQRFPYPVTMILEPRPDFPLKVSQGFRGVFVACPDQFIYDLVSAAPFPIAAATASPYPDIKTDRLNIAQEFFNDQVSLMVDGGKSQYARSGTLVDFTLPSPTIMTFGPVSVDDIRPFLPEIVLPSHLMK